MLDLTVSSGLNACCHVTGWLDMSVNSWTGVPNKVTGEYFYFLTNVFFSKFSKLGSLSDHCHHRIQSGDLWCLQNLFAFHNELQIDIILCPSPSSMKEVMAQIELSERPCSVPTASCLTSWGGQLRTTMSSSQATASSKELWWALTLCLFLFCFFA